MAVTVRSRVRGFIRDLVKPLGLNGWQIFTKVLKASELEDDTALGSAVDYEYKLLSIYIPDDLKPSDPALYSYVGHELMHAVVEPLARVANHLAGKDTAKRAIVRDAEESVVTHLTEILLRLKPEDKDA